MALFFHWTFCTHQLYSQLFTQHVSISSWLHLSFWKRFSLFSFCLEYFLTSPSRSLRCWKINLPSQSGYTWTPAKSQTPGQSGDSIGRSTPRTSILWVALAIKYEIQQTKHSSSPALWFQTQHATLLSLNRVLTMDSSSSTVRRRAWINSSRQWPTLEESEEPLCQLPSASIADDDVFSDGTVTNLNSSTSYDINQLHGNDKANKNKISN